MLIIRSAVIGNLNIVQHHNVEPFNRRGFKLENECFSYCKLLCITTILRDKLHDVFATDTTFSMKKYLIPKIPVYS